MATLVCFHAHPDDEAIATGGTMAKAAATGHRVVLVIATRGEHGEIVPGVLDDGEQLGLRRLQETFQAGAILGCARVEFLGYVDSGMMGEPTNEEPYSFWRADVDQAAHRLACILREEAADDTVVLTVYDDHGGYGHPDHIQVHRVGTRAAELASVSHVFQATMNRDQIRRGMGDDFQATMNRDQIRLGMEEMGVEGPGSSEEDDPPDPAEVEEFGEPEANITHGVDISAYLEDKRRSMRAHASQIADDSWFLTLADEAFAMAFGTEWFVRSSEARPEGAPFEDDLFADL